MAVIGPRTGHPVIVRPRDSLLSLDRPGGKIDLSGPFTALAAANCLFRKAVNVIARMPP
jgi:hypothetical protein